MAQSNVYQPPTNYNTSTNTSNVSTVSPGTGLTDQSANPNSITEKYETNYYSGSQVAIWMGNIWLDDISMIEFTLNQKKMPFYGYKSQLYDQVAMGTQIIEGVFTVAYTHTNWLNMARSKYEEFTNPQSNKDQSGLNENDINTLINQSKAGNIDFQTLKPTTPLVGIGTPESNSLTKLRESSFDNTTQELINFFWGNTSTAGNSYKVKSPDNLAAFDITITFGNYPKDRPSANDEFLSSHTIKVLSNVEITGYSMQVAITGEPIQEAYTFIARSMDTPLTRKPKLYKMVDNSTAGTAGNKA